MKKIFMDQEQPIMTYMRVPPRRFTFSTPRLQSWIFDRTYQRFENPRVLNLFAGITRIEGIDEFRVDLVSEVEYKGEMFPTYADYIGNAYDFVVEYREMIDDGMVEPFDIAYVDPPYNLRKAREKYGGRYIGSFTKIKNELIHILTETSRVITWGYSSVGMSKSRGFDLTEVLLMCHSGDHNDTIVTVEDRI